MGDCVLIGGVFDPLHAGHLAYIREAQKHGDVACWVSDAPHKHPPLVPLDQRAWLLLHLGVHPIKGDVSFDGLLDYTGAKFYIKGKDWEGRLPLDQVEACARRGVQIIYTETVTQSSSRLLADYQRRLNAAKLAEFERWVTTQPSPQPWEPVTDYSRETRRAIEAPQADIIADVFKGCTVLDYGCGFGYLVELLTERGMLAKGWDPDPRRGTHFPMQSAQFNLVICREVLEHLPVRTLVGTVQNLVKLSTRYVYVTTRFTAQAHLLDFDARDDLDPTHCTLLNQDFLRTLFVLEGCTRRADLEAKLDHKNLGRVLVYEVPRG